MGLLTFRFLGAIEGRQCSLLGPGVVREGQGHSWGDYAIPVAALWG